MTWHTEVVAATKLADLLAMIRRVGGAVTNSCPETGQVRVTWTTSSSERSDNCDGVWG
jgi:hypothetical protein